MKEIIRYCRQCYTVNLIEDKFCRKCGSLLVFSKENNSQDNFCTEKSHDKGNSYYEKYLLEQIAVLEIRLDALYEQVEKLKRLLAEQSRISRQNSLPFTL
ncbi:MAG: hypothetical protein ACK419_07255, partial [Pyrinomonadaceae bacterium]